MDTLLNASMAMLKRTMKLFALTDLFFYNIKGRDAQVVHLVVSMKPTHNSCSATISFKSQSTITRPSPFF